VSDEERPWRDTGYDAEIQRDAVLRARPREARHADGAKWSPPKIVAMAKCQAHVAGCKNTVEVTEDGLHALETFSALLTKRNERPLDLNECFLCPSCAKVRASVEAEKAATRRTKTTEAIRYCKQ
jgi:NAD-dependent dihydropyrimidine dehydrogenase PreA subunit